MAVLPVVAFAPVLPLVESWPGAAFCAGVPAPGVPCSCAPGVCGEVPGVCGVVVGCCGAVLGVEVCEPAVVPLCWSELGPEVDVLLGWVWAATQIAENSSTEKSMVLVFMTVS